MCVCYLSLCSPELEREKEKERWREAEVEKESERGRDGEVEKESEEDERRGGDERRRKRRGEVRRGGFSLHIASNPLLSPLKAPPCLRALKWPCFWFLLVDL